MHSKSQKDILCLDEAIPLDLNPKADVMVRSCLDWFNDVTDRQAMLLRILTRREVFSLRIVDWMVTNYSKYHRILILYRGMPLDVHDDYQRHLSVFNKKLFDPFARRQRITIQMGSQTYLTTVGQLNFLKWFIARDLHLVVTEKKEAIEQDMKQGNKQSMPLRAALYHHGPFVLDFNW